MKKIKRKFTGQENWVRIIYQENLKLRGLLKEFMGFVEANGLIDKFDMWAKLKANSTKEGGDANAVQGNGKEGCQDASKGKDGSCGCGEGACCKEGKEEVGKEGVG